MLLFKLTTLLARKIMILEKAGLLIYVQPDDKLLENLLQLHEKHFNLFTFLPYNGISQTRSLYTLQHHLIMNGRLPKANQNFQHISVIYLTLMLLYY